MTGSQLWEPDSWDRNMMQSGSLKLRLQGGWCQSSMTTGSRPPMHSRAGGAGADLMGRRATSSHGLAAKLRYSRPGATYHILARCMCGAAQVRCTAEGARGAVEIGAQCPPRAIRSCLATNRPSAQRRFGGWYPLALGLACALPTWQDARSLIAYSIDYIPPCLRNVGAFGCIRIRDILA